VKPSVALVLFPLLLASCASVHPGNIADRETNNPKIPLIVSGEVDTSIDAKANEMINLTFENTGDQWVRVDTLEVLINPSELNRVSVVVGKDLGDWVAAYSAKRKLDSYNRSVLLGGLLIGGAIVNAAAGDSDSRAWQMVGAAGAVSTAVGSGMLASDVYSRIRGRAEKPRHRTEASTDHAFAIPGKLFVRKWILMNKPTDRVIDKLVLRLTTVEGEVETYVIHLLQ
jgi:hypothetical protein